jgi:type III secretion protein L
VVAYYRLRDFGFALAAGGYVVPRSEFTAIEEATALLEQAEATCAEIVEQARETYESEKRRGYEEGLASARVEVISQLLRESSELDRGLRAVERDLAAIVAECVHKLLLGVDDAIRAEAVVRAALRQMRREKRAELRVPSALYPHFKERIDDILKEFPEVELVDVVEDRALEPTRVIFETAIGRVDGNIAQRLDDLENEIRSACARASVDALDAAITGAAL